MLTTLHRLSLAKKGFNPKDTHFYPKDTHFYSFNLLKRVSL